MRTVAVDARFPTPDDDTPDAATAAFTMHWPGFTGTISFASMMQAWSAAFTVVSSRLRVGFAEEVAQSANTV